VSDASVRQALRSDARLVVVEAPAGCGKTHQGADYVGEVAGNNRERVLILTHTHAACSVFAKRTRVSARMWKSGRLTVSLPRLPLPITLDSALPPIP
jgi:DNA helicase-2/ATP-dependent DNA helicase PcrA